MAFGVFVGHRCNSFLTSRAETPKRIGLGLNLIGGIGATIGNRVFQVAETWVFKTRKHKKLSAQSSKQRV